MYRAATNYFLKYFSPLISSNFIAECRINGFRQLCPKSFLNTSNELRAHSCDPTGHRIFLFLPICTADVSLPCHIMSHLQLSLCFLLKFTELSYSSVQPSLFLISWVMIIFLNQLQIHGSAEGLWEHPHSPFPLRETAFLSCLKKSLLPFLSCLRNLRTHRRTSPLTPWKLIETKPIF